MEGNFQEILDSLAEKPPRSRLEPYRGLIEELVRRGRTFREIRTILADKCGVRVALSTLHGFIAPQAQPRQLTSPSLPSTRVEKPARISKENSDGNTNECQIDQVWQRIEALKNRKPPETKPEGFSYDPDQPLRLLRKDGKHLD